MQSNEKQILDLTVPLTETRVTQYFNICVASEMQLRQTILTGIKTKASFASALTLETVMMLTASEISTKMRATADFSLKGSHLLLLASRYRSAKS